MHRFMLKSRQGGKNADKPDKKKRKNKKSALTKGLALPLNLTIPADDENNNSGRKPLPKIPDNIPKPALKVDNDNDSNNEQPYEDVSFVSTQLYDDLPRDQDYFSDEEGVYEMTSAPPRRNTGFSEPDPEIYSHLDAGAGAASSSNYDCLRYDGKIATNEAIYDSYPDMKGGQSSRGTGNNADSDDDSYAPIMFEQESYDKSSNSDVTELSKKLSNLSHEEESIYETQMPRKFSLDCDVAPPEIYDVTPPNVELEEEESIYEVQLGKRFSQSDATASKSEDSYSVASSDGYDVTPPSIDNYERESPYEVHSPGQFTTGNDVSTSKRISQGDDTASDDVMPPPEKFPNVIFCEEAIYTARPPPTPSSNFNESFESSENEDNYHGERFTRCDVTEYDDVRSSNMAEESACVVSRTSPVNYNRETNMTETEDIYDLAGDVSDVIKTNFNRTGQAPSLPPKPHRPVNNDVTGSREEEPASPSAYNSYETEDVYEVARHSSEGVTMKTVHSAPAITYSSDVTVTESASVYDVARHFRDVTGGSDRTSTAEYHSNGVDTGSENIYNVAGHFDDVTGAGDRTSSTLHNNDVTFNELANVYGVTRHFGEVTSGREAMPARALHRTSSAGHNTDVRIQSPHNSDVTEDEDIYEMARDFNKVAARRRKPMPHRGVHRTSSSPHSSDVTATEDVYEVARNLPDVTASNFKNIRELPSVPPRPPRLGKTEGATSGRLPLPVPARPVASRSHNEIATDTEDIYDVAQDLPPATIPYFKTTSEAPGVPSRQPHIDVTGDDVTNRFTNHTRRHPYHDITIQVNKEPSIATTGPPKLPKKPTPPKKSTNYGGRVNRKSRDQRKVSPRKVSVDEIPQFEVSKSPLTRKKSSLVQSTRISVAEAINFFKEASASKSKMRHRAEANSRREAGRVTKLRNTANRPTAEEKQDVSARIKVYNSSSGPPPPLPCKRKPIPPPKPRKSTKEKKDSELANNAIFKTMQKKLNT